jgi:hypothetical protein
LFCCKISREQRRHLQLLISFAKLLFVQDVTDFRIYSIFILKIFKFNIKQFDKNIVLSYNTFNVILKSVHLMKGKSNLLRQVPESRWMVKTGDGGQRKILPEDWR